MTPPATTPAAAQPCPAPVAPTVGSATRPAIRWRWTPRISARRARPYAATTNHGGIGVIEYPLAAFLECFPALCKPDASQMQALGLAAPWLPHPPPKNSASKFLTASARPAFLRVRSNAPVAQLDRASDYESEGWGFEFLRVYHLVTHSLSMGYGGKFPSS